MRTSKMQLNLDDLSVDSFGTSADPAADPQQMQIYYTVLYETEALSCGGTCGSCPCWA